MTYDRRKFLKQSAGLSSGIAFASFTGNLLSAETFMAEKKKIKNFGLQLWSVRDDMGKDAKGTLKQLSSFGYRQIESFEGGKGMFWGMTNTEFKKYMDELGMTIVSSHCNIDKDFEKKAAEAAAIGAASARPSPSACGRASPSPARSSATARASRPPGSSGAVPALPGSS